MSVKDIVYDAVVKAMVSDTPKDDEFYWRLGKTVADLVKGERREAHANECDHRLSAAMREQVRSCTFWGQIMHLLSFEDARHVAMQCGGIPVPASEGGGSDGRSGAMTPKSKRGSKRTSKNGDETEPVDDLPTEGDQSAIAKLGELVGN
ncbi:unnamed protein product [Caenorhabditis bovis]|uniref:Uncharacterized protein n=1 Tax=Caenorhabditis bovis TaxID=2654633 RepID=A0A8S1EU97_9PELO|nr:unnamed protein product [Caenorhabditis bovis]